MLMDAIDDELRTQSCDESPRKCRRSKILANTDYIYMMANQIALLDLTRLKHIRIGLEAQRPRTT